jgi:hypothetical protein
MSVAPNRTEIQLPPGPAPAAVVLEPILARAAGEGVNILSLALDYGVAAAAGEAVVVEVDVDRTTRTLVFLHADMMRASDRAVIASATAIFRRPTSV